jgi:vacuolar-type H+-ATPase subunit F/Vma7
MEKLKVAMIGGRTSTLGFKAIGVDTYVAPAPEDGPDIWQSLPLQRYGVIVITEPVYLVLRERVPDFPGYEGLPIILVVPAVTGSLEVGREELKGRVEKAVGAIMKG